MGGGLGCRHVVQTPVFSTGAGFGTRKESATDRCQAAKRFAPPLSRGVSWPAADRHGAGVTPEPCLGRGSNRVGTFNAIAGAVVRAEDFAPCLCGVKLVRQPALCAGSVSSAWACARCAAATRSSCALLARCSRAARFATWQARPAMSRASTPHILPVSPTDRHRRFWSDRRPLLRPLAEDDAVARGVWWCRSTCLTIRSAC